MFAFEIPNMRFSLPAGEDIPRYRFVTINSNGNAVVARNAGNDAIIGVSMNEAKEGEVLEVADGLVMVAVDSGLAAGMPVITVNGCAAEAEDLGSSSAVAITSATAAGELITVKM